MCRSRGPDGDEDGYSDEDKLIMRISVPLLGTGILCMYVGLVRSTTIQQSKKIRTLVVTHTEMHLATERICVFGAEPF